MDYASKNLHLRASESLEELRKSFEGAGIGRDGGMTLGSTSGLNRSRLSMRGISGHGTSTNSLFAGDRQRRNSWSDGRYQNDLSYRAAADKLGQMIASKESRLNSTGSPRGVQFSPPRGSHFVDGLPPSGRASVSLPNIPDQDVVANMMTNQSAYIQMLEAENKYSREELTQLKLKTNDLVEENKRLHQDLKSSVVADLLNSEALRKSRSVEDVQGRLRQTDDQLLTGNRFQLELDRIGVMYASKNKRLETQLAQAREDLEQMSSVMEEMRSDLRKKECVMYQEMAEQNLRSGTFSLSGATMTNGQLERLTKERDELVSTVSALRGRVERLQQQENELYEQLSSGIETVEQAKLEETQAVVHSRQLTEELFNLRQRFDDQVLENQRRLEEERKLARKEVQAELEALTKQLRESEQEVARRDTRLDKEIKKSREMAAGLEQARLQVRAYETDHTKTRDDLQASLTRAGLHRDQAVAELSRMQHRLDAEQQDRAQERQILMAEVEDLRTRLHSAERETMTSSEDRLRLTNENQNLLREMNLYKMQRDAAQRGRREELDSIRLMAQKRETELQHFISQLEGRHESTINELNDMLGRHSELVERLREECRMNVAQMEQLTNRYQRQVDGLVVENEQFRHQAEKRLSQLREVEAQCVEHGRTHEKMRDRISKMDDHGNHQAQQIVELLARQNALLRDRQLLAKEVEFLRAQLTMPINLADSDKLVSDGGGLVNDVLRKVRFDHSDSPTPGLGPSADGDNEFDTRRGL